MLRYPCPEQPSGKEARLAIRQTGPLALKMRLSRGTYSSSATGMAAPLQNHVLAILDRGLYDRAKISIQKSAMFRVHEYD